MVQLFDAMSNVIWAPDSFWVLQVWAADLTVFTPPGVEKKDIAVLIPDVYVKMTKQSKSETKETRHAWAVEVQFTDMKVHYTYLSLKETNIDRIVKEVLKEKAQEVPEEHRTEALKQVANDQGNPALVEGRPEEPAAVAVTKLHLKGRTQVLLRAGELPLLPPVMIYETEIDPEVLKSPVGLFLWINSVVLRTLEGSGIDLVTLVTRSAIQAGLVSLGTSEAVIRGMVTGGQTALTCTYNGVAYAAKGTVSAGTAIVSTTWDGAEQMMGVVGLGLQEVSNAGASLVGGITGAAISVGNAGGAVGGAVGGALKGAGQATVSSAVSGGEAIGSAGASLVGGIADLGQNTTSAVAEGASFALSSVSTGISSLFKWKSNK